MFILTPRDHYSRRGPKGLFLPKRTPSCPSRRGIGGQGPEARSPPEGRPSSRGPSWHVCCFSSGRSGPRSLPLRGLVREPSGRTRLFAVIAVACALVLGAAGVSAAGDRPAAGRAGLEERPGRSLPADIFAADEQGRPVRLVDLVDRPVILALVYYSCEHVCPLVLSALG